MPFWKTINPVLAITKHFTLASPSLLAAASPATGYAKKHEQEQMAIVEEAFGK